MNQKILATLLCFIAFFWTSCQSGEDENQQNTQKDNAEENAENTATVVEKCDSLIWLKIETETFQTDSFMVRGAWLEEDQGGYMKIILANYPQSEDKAPEDPNSYAARTYNSDYYFYYADGYRNSVEKIKLILELTNQEGEINAGTYKYLTDETRVFSPTFKTPIQEYFLHGQAGGQECGVLELKHISSDSLCGQIQAKVEKNFIGEAFTLQGNFALKRK